MLTPYTGSGIWALDGLDRSGLPFERPQHGALMFVRQVSGHAGLMDLIVEMRFGSHLYGTATPQSDLDFKAVYLPEPRAILLQRVQATGTHAPEKLDGEKNAPGDVDREIHSLQRYLALLAEGQTMALDMLFAPDFAMTRPPAPLWRDIQANADRLVTRRASAFLSYCRQQANKYGIKGSRVAAARQALAVLTTAEAKFGTTERLAVVEPELNALKRMSEHAMMIDLPTPGATLLLHFEICGKKMPFTSSIKTAREIIQRLVAEYGQRALLAERNAGIDWKALSHAVRVGREALELFQTGRLTFPLPYASEILSIEQGHLPYDRVAETIDQLLVDVEAAAMTSSLRREPDFAFIDDWVVIAYRAQVLGKT